MDNNQPYIIKQNKKLKRGYTTGTCAAAATKAALFMMLSHKSIEKIMINTPKGVTLELDISNINSRENEVSCSIKKYSGDDPDITNGIFIYSKVNKNCEGKINVFGGIGVGKITKPGLACEIGKPAINPIPMNMIITEVTNICKEFDYSGGIDVTISVPDGEEIAKKTFNPRLGIIGGISILGTTGIVEPMSEKALVETIFIEMRQKREMGVEDLIVCPGNYGQDFIKREIGVEDNEIVICSNFIGEMLDFSLQLEYKSVLIVGHAGKLIKLAGGVMNTHSKYADCRMDMLALHYLLNGGSVNNAQKILESVTTEEAVKVINNLKLLHKTIESIMKKIEYYVNSRVFNSLDIGVLTFTNDIGVLGMTHKARNIMNRLHKH